MRNRPLLLGHRGTRAVSSIPENTFAAFDRALEDGCDGFELDVRLTRDGRGVICHDPRHRNLTLAQVDASRVQELPMLDKVLERYASRAFLDIELKVAGLETCVAAALESNPPTRGYVVSSFLPDVLSTIHESGRDVPLGFICDRGDRLALWRGLPVRYVIPHRSLVSRELLEEVHAADKSLFVWTVNADADMERMAEWEVDGVISDDTRSLVRVLRRSPL
jgi:glycerophosphoryl diester phosphodiesterase